MSANSSTAAPPIASSAPAPRVLLRASLLAMFIATPTMIVLHELSHAVVGLGFGVPEVLYSFAVVPDPPLTAAQEAPTAIAGPLFSLVSGYVLSVWTPLRSRGGFGHLLWLWVAFVSIQEGVTYFVITPFGAGDTAAFISDLRWPAWTVFAFFALGLAGMFWQARRWAVVSRRLCGDDIASARALSSTPWFIGAPILVVFMIILVVLAPLNLDPATAIVIATSALGVTVFAPMSFIFRGRTQAAFEGLRLTRVPTWAYVTLGVVVLLMLALTRGVTLG